ncbi:MAG TPA: hypothetical protein VM198_14935 [Longimicrobiales bacterium]|nr:hypothetical protein [Longimicrobiales bacterium]
MTTRTPVGVVLVGALLAAASGGTLEAQSSLGLDGVETSGSSDRDRIVWTAGALVPLLSARDYPSILLLSALGRVAEERGEAAVGGLGSALHALSAPALPGSVAPFSAATSPPSADSGVGGCRVEASGMGAALCSMERLVPLVPSHLAREVTEQGARLVALHSAPTRASDPLQGFAEEALERVWKVRMGEADRGGPTAALDGVLGSMVGLAPGGGAAEALARAPALRHLLDAHPLVVSSLASPGPVNAVLDEYQAFLGGVTGSLGGLLAPAAASGGSAAFPMPLAGTPGAPESEGATAWAVSRSFVYLASRSAELAGAGPGVSDRIRTLGTAAVDLQREAGSFPSSLASVGRDLAVATLTGNILGVASRITSFFQGNPGALGFGAGREVHAVREGIDALRGELRAGFDGVDQRMDDLLGSLDARFSLLEVLVESNNRSVQAQLASLHEGVVALGERLDRMDGTVRSYIQAGFDRDYARTLVRCLEHRERYLPPFDEMEFTVFSECLADFRTRAVGDARDALLTDQTTPVDDMSLVSALADPSLENLSMRLPLLGRAAERRFDDSRLRGGRGLANPVEWTVAAEAYLSMLREWPMHAQAVSAGDVEAIRSVGVELQGALGAIVRDDAPDGRAALLGRVLTYYADRLREVTGEADVLARRHRQEVLLRVDPRDVLVRLESEDPRFEDLPVPEAVEQAVPREVRTAVVLGLDSAELSYRLVSEDSLSSGNVRRRLGLFGRRHDRFTFTRTRIEVELRVGSLGMIARYHTAGPYDLRLTEEMDGDHTSQRVRKQTTHIGDPARHFLADAWPRVATNSSAWRLEAEDPWVVDGMEARIETELRRYATVGLNNVFTSVCAEGVEGPSLSPADRSSALRIRSTLTGLSAARVLLESYLRLGLLDAVEEHGALRETLVGSNAILDRTALCAVVANGESALRLVWLEEEPARRLDALADSLDSAVRASIDTGGPRTLVDPTLERLDAAIRVQRLRAAVPSTR